MSSSREYVDFVLEQLSELDEITHRAMMGEYLIYYKGKVIGGIYDDRFLIKPVQAAKDIIGDVQYEIPYENAKGMILVDNLEDKLFLKKLIDSMYDELPFPKSRKKKKSK